jgi:uncharacterized protein
MTVLVAVTGGALIGLLLGSLGAGGSILAVPVLVYGLGQGPYAATTGSLVVVGSTAAVAAVAAHRAGNVRLDRGLVFATAALAGTAVGAHASGRVPEHVLLAAFAGLMLAVAVVMAVRRTAAPSAAGPVLAFRPFRCECPRALQVAATATAAGLATGFLGVGGGFLVVPALTLALGMGIREAAGTSLVVITVTSTVALAVRLDAGARVEWAPVLLLAGSAVVAAVLGARLGPRLAADSMRRAFIGLLVLVAGLTIWQAVPGLA